MAARIIARVLVMTVGPVIRAFAQAYRQAARWFQLIHLDAQLRGFRSILT